MANRDQEDRSLWADCRGVSAMELALILGMTATLAATAATQVGDGLTAVWKVVADAFPK